MALIATLPTLESALRLLPWPVLPEWRYPRHHEAEAQKLRPILPLERTCTTGKLRSEVANPTATNPVARVALSTVVYETAGARVCQEIRDLDADVLMVRHPLCVAMVPVYQVAKIEPSSGLSLQRRVRRHDLEPISSSGQTTTTRRIAPATTSIACPTRRWVRRACRRDDQ